MTHYFGSFLDGCMLWIVMECATVPFAFFCAEVAGPVFDVVILFMVVTFLLRYVAGGSLSDVIATKCLDEQCIAGAVVAELRNDANHILKTRSRSKGGSERPQVPAYPRRVPVFPGNALL
jgi:hypothetical protein